MDLIRKFIIAFFYIPDERTAILLRYQRIEFHRKSILFYTFDDKNFPQTAFEALFLFHSHELLVLYTRAKAHRDCDSVSKQNLLS